MDRSERPRRVIATSPSAGSDRFFTLPETLVTTDTWQDTDAVSHDTAGQGVWVRNERGIYAHRKPGVAIPGSDEALREVVCSVIAGWLGVATPKMELMDHPDHGACSLSYDLPEGQTYRWFNVMEMKLTHDLYATGCLMLELYAGPVTVLDILVGACDRRNSGNHLYVENERRWYTIDYGFSFNCYPQRGGVGDPALGYGHVLKQDWWSEIVAAIGRSKDSLEQALKLAEAIPDEAFEGLLSLPPEAFGDGATRGKMVTFLQYRRSRIRDLVREWCGRVGLAGMVA
jgi:hypothetical protein